MLKINQNFIYKSTACKKIGDSGGIFGKGGFMFIESFIEKNENIYDKKNKNLYEINNNDFELVTAEIWGIFYVRGDDILSSFYDEALLIRNNYIKSCKV